MMALLFRIKLLEPVLTTSLQGDPNSSVSYPFIPGGQIRGAIIGQYMNRAGSDVTTIGRGTEVRQSLKMTETVRDLFFNGQTRYLNAYLISEDDKRTLPVSRSWYKDKYTTEPIYDRAHPNFNEAEFRARVPQPKPVDKPFGYLDGEAVEFYAPETVISVHTQRERRAGRATMNEGEMFRYEALAADQSFQGCVLCDKPETIETIKALLTGKLFLGRSIGAGYGLVRIETVRQVSNWNETDSEAAAIAANTPLTITLLSNMILRDENGQYTDTLSREAVAQALNLDPTTLSEESARTFKRSTMVGGFNRKWELPLPQTITIQAGSVFGFRSAVPIPVGPIERLLAAGLGERRVEGFGRIAINRHADNFEIEVYQPDPSAPPELRPSSLNEESAKLARQMVTRLLHREADRVLGKAINEHTITTPPHKSQLGRLRLIVRQAMVEEQPQSVRDYLDEMKRAGKRQLELARIERGGESERLWGWLEKLLKNPTTVWENIGYSDKEISIGPVKKQAGQDENLALEYTLRLIDGTLAKAAKEAKGAD